MVNVTNNRSLPLDDNNDNGEQEKDKKNQFDFQLKSIRNKMTVLHYVIRKANYDAFIYLVGNRLVDFLSYDMDNYTAR